MASDDFLRSRELGVIGEKGGGINLREYKKKYHPKYHPEH